MIDTSKNSQTIKNEQAKDMKVTASTAGPLTQPVREEEMNLRHDDVQVMGKSHAPGNDTPQVAEIVKSEGFDDAMKQAGEQLAKCPDALDFGATNSDRVGKFFAFANNSQEAVQVRSAVQKTLKDLYDQGAYSPGDFASRLGVEANAVWALIDPSFRSDNNLAVHQDNLLDRDEPAQKASENEQKQTQEVEEKMGKPFSSTTETATKARTNK